MTIDFDQAEFAAVYGTAVTLVGTRQTEQRAGLDTLGIPADRAKRFATARGVEPGLPRENRGTLELSPSRDVKRRRKVA